MAISRPEWARRRLCCQILKGQLSEGSGKRGDGWPCGQKARFSIRPLCRGQGPPATPGGRKLVWKKAERERDGVREQEWRRERKGAEETHEKAAGRSGEKQWGGGDQDGRVTSGPAPGVRQGAISNAPCRDRYQRSN